MSQEPKAANTATATPKTNAVQNIPIDKLKPFRFHVFKTYVGKKMDQLVQSIKVNGVMQPVIGRQLRDSGSYEIISGHNRVEAAKKAGLPEIPVIVRDLSDDDAILLANETNMTQRSIKDWLPSEKAKSIAQYHKTIKRQGVRTDLQESETSGDNRQKSDDHARKKTADAYGLRGHHIKLYLELNSLDDKLMDRLDKGEFGTTPAQALSRIPAEIQGIVNTVIEEDKELCEITVANAKKVQGKYTDYSGKAGTEEETLKKDIRQLLSKPPEIPEEDAVHVVAIPMEKTRFDQYFLSQKPEEEAVISEIMKALDHYRNRHQAHNHKNGR